MTTDELPEDRTLPQLATVLDPQAMKAVFQQSLFTRGFGPVTEPTSRWEVRDCKLTWTKYRPGWDCRMAYELTLHDRNTSRPVTQRFYGRIYATGRPPARDRQAQCSRLVDPEAGPGFAYLPAVDMILWGFPNDRKLRGLPYLVNNPLLESRLGAALQESVCNARDLATEDWRIVNSETVHYVPERSCTIRATVTALGHGRSSKLTLYGKTYYGDEGKTTFDNMRQLCASPAFRTGELRIPEPCAYWPDVRILFQHALPGVPLGTYATDRCQWLAGLRRTGDAVAALHTADIPCAERDDTAELLDKLPTITQLMSQIGLPCHDQFVDVVNRLRRWTPGSSSRIPIVTLHGDLHSRNVLIDGDRAGLIDLDNVHRGPAWQDVGSFLAAVFAAGRVLGWSRTATRESATAFLDSYLARVPWPVDTVALRWHTALCLVGERVPRTITRMKAGQLRLVADLVELGQEFLDELYNYSGKSSSAACWP